MNSSPVGKKLGIAFGLLLSLLIGVGWLGLNRMSRTNADLNHLGRDAFKLELAQQAESYANLNIRLLMQVLTLNHKEDIERFRAKRNENRNKGADFIEALKPKIDSEKERALLANIDNARIPARNSVDRILSLLNEGKREEATQLMVNDTSPLLEKYQEAWDAFVQFQKDQMDQVQNQSEANYLQTRRIAIALMLIAIALSVVIAVFATQRIMRDDNLREETKEEVRKLNNELESKIAGRTADLASAIEKLESEIEVRRKREEDLKRSEAELAIAQRIAHVGSFHQILASLDDIESNPMHLSDEVYHIFGLMPGQIEPLRANFVQAIHPDDRERVVRAGQGAILSKGAYDLEYRIILPDANERIVHTRWEIAYDRETGKPLRLFGTIQDITERKKAEERFYKAFNANPEPIAIATIPEQRYVNVNESFLLVTGTEVFVYGTACSLSSPALHARKRNRSRCRWWRWS